MMRFPYFADPEQTLIQVSAGICLTYEHFIGAGGNLPDVAPFMKFSTLEPARAQLAAAVKAQAAERILARYPVHAQLNAAARAIELIELKFMRSLSSAEEREETAIRILYEWIKNIRAAAASKEAEIQALQNIEAANAYDSAAGWPA